MNGKTREHLIRFAVGVVVPLVVGLGSAVISAQVMLGRLDARVGAVESLTPRVEKLEHTLPPLEVQISRHEKALEKDFARHEQTVSDISHKTDDQEKRLTRLEALFNHTLKTLDEIRTDVKILLRGGQQ